MVEYRYAKLPVPGIRGATTSSFIFIRPSGASVGPDKRPDAGGVGIGQQFIFNPATAIRGPMATPSDPWWLKVIDIEVRTYGKALYQGNTEWETGIGIGGKW